jgi:predicted permease
MTGWLWRRIEARLRRDVPGDRVGSVLVELAEDYAERRSHLGAVRAGLWLLTEGRSLAVAYRRRDRRQPRRHLVVEAGRDAIRSRRRRPWSLAASVGLLALAVGIATTMFTIVDALILRPAPFKDPEQLASVSMVSDRLPIRSVSPAVFEAWRRSPAFTAVEAAAPGDARVGSDPLDIERRIARVTPGVFSLLGNVRPLHGRLFEPSDGSSGREDVVLLSEDLWRASFQADAAIVGRAIVIGGQPAVVVGILPSDFHFPEWNTVAWKASRFDGPETRSTASWIPAVVRFAPGVPRADALQVATAAARDADSRVGTWTARAWPLADAVLEPRYQSAVPLLWAGVVLLFAVLCANASSLQLAGMSARAREIATRTALGASRARLVWQAFFESAIAGAAGVAMGIGLAEMLLSGARVWLLDPLRLHSLHAVDLDGRALAVASLSGFLATLAAGVLPALLGTRVDASRSLGAASRGGTESRQARAAVRTLLVCQIALSCTLLFGAALLVRSSTNLMTADRGFDTRGMLVASIQASTPSLTTPEARALATRAMQDAALAIPGIRGATWSYGMPPAGAATMTGEWTSDAPASPKVTMDVYQFRVQPEFFSYYDIPVVRGRAFQRTDAASVVLVSERLAGILWPGQDPIGRTFAFNGQFGPQVIGVVRDIRFPSLDSTLDAPQYYAQFGAVTTMATLSLRCDLRCPDPEQIRRQLAAAAPGAQVRSVRPLEASYARELARPGAASALAVAFAATALVAAAAGLFSLLTHSLARRRREFGIRSALGASPADVRRLVWRDGIAVMLAGALIGTVACFWLGRLLSSLLYEVAATDLVSWGIVLSALAAAMAAASWHPTRVAAHGVPASLLREE